MRGRGLPSWLWVTTHSSASWCTPVRTPRDSSLHCSSSSWTWSVGTPHPPRLTPTWWESLHDPAVRGTPRGKSHRTGSPQHWPGSVQVKTKADARFSVIIVFLSNVNAWKKVNVMFFCFAACDINKNDNIYELLFSFFLTYIIYTGKIEFSLPF